MSLDGKMAARLYGDLLIRCITNTIYQDIPQDPWSGGTYAEALRTEGRDWPSRAHSMIGVKRLENLRTLTEAALADEIPGDFIETGVWRGGACILMRGLLAAHGVSDRKVIVADSFQGLPPSDDVRFPADAGDTHHKFQQLAIPLESVQGHFAAYGLLDDQVEFLKGWFSDTLPTLADRHFALIRLDGDMYQSTIEALDNLYDRLSPGGFIIIDDYGAVPACRAAVEDFRGARNITEPMEQVDWTGVWWRKPC
ncbi:TylF/MycF family methyltransferase [Mesorhizobium sp.]|uniref:TylF/MycF family methyltransferase n=1 Tax=Mesorhizobium sp. TaxID=1871066 RepID=UPI0025EF6A24|nr:TylF/MycF family methyltransferase [Mesorhizobium sp.]